MSRSDLAALPAFVALGWRRAAADRIGIAGRVALYGLLLFIFWELWAATPLVELGRSEVDAAHLFWYLVVTECVAIGGGQPYRFVEAEIRSGGIAAGLTRPVPYAWATLADWVGETSHRVLLLAIAGVIAGVTMTGTAPFSWAAAPAVLLSLGLGCGMVLLCQLQLGHAAAWVGSAAPLFWVWQKLAFVLGGLILPLDLYPPPLRVIAEATPFAAMLYAPGSLVLGPSAVVIAATVGGQLVWFAALAAATVLIDRAMVARFAVEGV
jgi:ABC-2 type transport system permease protein